MYKTKGENKILTNEFKYCLELNFVAVNRLCVLVYPNQDNDKERFNAQKYLPNGIYNQKIITSSSMKKKMMINQSILI